jgi:glutathionylspermidine synthase
MHELFPGHPNILPAFNSPEPLKGQAYVKKPKLGREGSNVEIYDSLGIPMARAGGDYGDEGYVYQRMARLAHHAGRNAAIGAWVIGDTPAGVSMRETSTLITSDLAGFVPHFIKQN